MPSFLKLTFFFLFSFYILHTTYYIPTIYAQENCEGAGESPVGANLKLDQSYADDISKALIPPDINEANAASQKKVCTGIKQGISGLICNVLSPFGIFESFCTQEVNLGRNTGTFNKQQKALSDAAGVYPYLQRSPQPYNEDVIKDVREDQTGNKILSAFADRAGRNNANYYTAGYIDELRSKALDERDSISIGSSTIEDSRTKQARPEMCLEFLGDYPPGFTPEKYIEADCKRFLQSNLQTQTATSSGDYSIQAYMIYSSEPSLEDATRDMERLKRSLEASQEWYQANVGKIFKIGQLKKAVIPESSDYLGLGWDLPTIGDNLRKAIHGNSFWPKSAVTVLVLKDNAFDALGFAMGFDQNNAFIDYPNNGPGALTQTAIAVEDNIYARLATCNLSGAGCLGAQQTLSHELGHAFGLPHTETAVNFLSNTRYSPIMLDNQKEFLKTSPFLK